MAFPDQTPGPLTKALLALGGALALVLGFMFSLVIVAVALVVGAGVWGWFWWKTRHLRRAVEAQLRAQVERAASAESGGASRAGGTIIEGEAVVVEETTIRATSNRLPASPDRRSPD